MIRLVRLAKGMGALVVLGAIVLGIPWALWHFIGWPLPHTVPDWEQVRRGLDQRGIPDQVLIKALASVVWITWATLVAAIAVEIPAAVTGRTARQLRVVGLFQPLTGHLVAAVIFAILAFGPKVTNQSAPGSLGALSSGGGHRAVPSVIVGTELASTTWTLPAAETSASPSPTDSIVSSSSSVGSGPTTTYVVQRGDTLWGIAEHELGDPLRWAAIYQLNEGRLQPDGQTLNDPHWIDPGWDLILPSVATAPSVAPIVATPPLPGSAVVVPSVPPTPSGGAVAQTQVTTPLHGASSSAPVSTTGTHRAESTADPITLLSGSVIGGSFGAGVLSALAAGRLRRRRHYHAQSPRPSRAFNPQVPSYAIRDLLVSRRTLTDDEQADFTSISSEDLIPMTVVPDDDAIAHPDLVEVASRAGEVVRLALCQWPGLTVSGPGAASSLRAWLASLLTRNGPLGAEIIVVGPLGDRLFPDLDLPGLRRIETAGEGLSRLEAAIIDRTRRLDDANVPDVTAHRREAPEYPLPLVLCVTDLVPESLVPRWRTMLASATRLGLAALVLTPDHSIDGGRDDQKMVNEDGSGELSDTHAQIVVDVSGSAQVSGPRVLADLLEGSRLFQLSATEGADLLGPIALIHNDHEFDQAGSADGSAEELEAEAAANGTRAPVEMEDELGIAWPRLESNGPEPKVIQVDVFGAAHVEAWGEKVGSGLRASAYELLAWFALHPEGATAESAIDALWPDVSPKRGRERFWTALGNLRSRLHGPGESGTAILTKVGEHYLPDLSVLDIDLWRFEAALTEAVQADEATGVIGALECASASYGGDFYPSADAPWVEPVREDLHRKAIDVHIRLAELHVENGQLDVAIAALERTIEIDSICEDAYRRLIILQSELGRADAAQRTWRLLQGRLTELDLEPEAATTDLVREMVASRPTRAGGRLSAHQRSA
jgi:DNA-binding SARP family transcriptional activator